MGEKKRPVNSETRTVHIAGWAQLCCISPWSVSSERKKKCQTMQTQRLVDRCWTGPVSPPAVTHSPVCRRVCASLPSFRWELAAIFPALSPVPALPQSPPCRAAPELGLSIPGWFCCLCCAGTGGDLTWTQAPAAPYRNVFHGTNSCYP